MNSRSEHQHYHVRVRTKRTTAKNFANSRSWPMMSCRSRKRPTCHGCGKTWEFCKMATRCLRTEISELALTLVRSYSVQSLQTPACTSVKIWVLAILYNLPNESSRCSSLQRVKQNFFLTINEIPRFSLANQIPWLFRIFQEAGSPEYSRLVLESTIVPKVIY